MVKALIPAQRQDQIRALLEQQRVASIAQLSDLLRVSEATVRRDLEALEAEGVLERTHGGAILTQRLPVEPAYAISAARHPRAKRAIARAAADQVADGEILLINSGTTTTEVLRHIGLRRDLTHVTILTTNVSAVLEARNAGLDLILLGGHFRPESNAVAGDLARRALAQVNADRCFIGVDGFSLKGGLTTPVSAEAEMARLMLERTRGTPSVVADSSKWGVVSNFEIAPIDQARVLISDVGMPDEAVAGLTERGLRVVRADLDPADRTSDQERVFDSRPTAARRPIRPG
jgi:DeoR family fructose operon transcriptional repressor